MKLATIANGSANGKLVVVSIDGELYLDPSEAAPTLQAALERWDGIDEADGRLRDAGLTLERGSVIRIVDMMPGGVSPMHRTNSIDTGSCCRARSNWTTARRHCLARATSSSSAARSICGAIAAPPTSAGSFSC